MDCFTVPPPCPAPAPPVQLPIPGYLPLIAAIIMQKFPGTVKLTCPENQCHIMSRLENWKHKGLAATVKMCGMVSGRST